MATARNMLLHVIIEETFDVLIHHTLLPILLILPIQCRS